MWWTSEPASPTTWDRWWNPAVENQIDRLIDAKRQLLRHVLEGGAARLLTEMKDDEILDVVALDLRAASAGE